MSAMLVAHYFGGSGALMQLELDHRPVKLTNLVQEIQKSQNLVGAD
jgi:hypothetical protein